MTTYVFKAEVCEEDDGRWSARVGALPGCATWGYTREEALKHLHEGTELYLECSLEFGDPIPDSETIGAGELSVTVTIAQVPA